MMPSDSLRLSPPLARPPSSAVQEGLCIAELLARYQDHPMLPAWLEGYVQQLHQPRWIGGLEPLPFDVWCQVLDGAALTPRQHWVFAQCRLLRAQDALGPVRAVHELVLMWGKGSGKSYLIAKLFSWLAYLLCSLKDDPAQTVGLARESGLVMINVAPNQDVARTVFFKYLCAFLRHPLLQHGDMRVFSDEVRFFREGAHGRYEFLSLYSRHSNARGLDGHNVFAFAGDEMDAFPRTPTHCRATQIHDILRSSAATRAPRAWIGAIFSYPRSPDGFITALYERALADRRANGERSAYFADRAATWEVRPDISRTQSAIESDYKSDPRRAALLYECLAAPAEDAFFGFPEYIEDALAARPRVVASWRTILGKPQTPTTVETKETPGTRRAAYARSLVQVQLAWVQPEPGRTYYMGVATPESGAEIALSVWSAPTKVSTIVEEVEEVPLWCCPQCGRDSQQCQEVAPLWQRQPTGTRWRAASPAEMAECAFCAELAPTAQVEYSASGKQQVVFWVSGWLRTPIGDALPEEGSAEATADSEVPHLQEALLLTWSPVRRLRLGERNVAIDLANVEHILWELMAKLPVKKLLCDSYLLQPLLPSLQGRGGCQVEPAEATHEASYARGRVVKALLHARRLALLPYATPEPGDTWSFGADLPRPGTAQGERHTGERARERQWRQLQCQGQRLLAPPHGSKTLFEAESLAIFAAATDQAESFSLDLAL